VHNPRVPSKDRFPRARAHRRPHRRLLVLGAVIALGALVVVPAVGRHGDSIDLSPTGAGNAATGQEPTLSDLPSIATVAASPLALMSVPEPTPLATQLETPLAPVSTPASTPMPAPTFPLTSAAEPRPRSQPNPMAADRIGPVAPAIDTLTGYRWPIAHPRLTLPFGPTPWGTRIVGGRPFHDGVDLATFCGDRILAAHAGLVLAAGRHYDEFMGWIGSLGPYLRRLDRGHLWPTLPIIVVIDDGNGYRSMYAHFGRIVVRPGQHVRAGQLLGYEGATGRASGCHLHYGLFSPWETAAFAMKPDVAKRMKLPSAEIARVDPLKVLPPKRGISTPRAPKPGTLSGTPTSP
jgi:murein DD-endopeptidase MepM/ murein hydrolase activator NlpD